MTSKKPENTAFAQYVTRTAFNLNLSHNQCLLLIDIADNGPNYTSYMFYMRLFIPTIHRLEVKGLVYGVKDEKDHYSWHLTDAGKLVAPLLKLAGMKLPKFDADSDVKVA